MRLPELTEQEKLDAALDDIAREQERKEAMQIRRLDETGKLKPSFLDKLTGKKYRKKKTTKTKTKRKPVKKVIKKKGCGCK